MRCDYNLTRLARVFCAASLAAIGVFITPNATAESVYLRGEIAQDSGETITVVLYRGDTGVAPSTLTLFLTFDNSAVELVPMDNGSYAQLAAAHGADGFVIADMYHHTTDDTPDQACLAIAVYQKTDIATTLPPGAFLAFSLRLTPTVTELSSFRIEAVTADKPVHINNVTFATSASSADEHLIPVRMESLTVPVNCIPPNPPEHVRASLRYRDHIAVSWEAPPNAESLLEYRVYRSAENDVAQAVPLADAWTTDLTYRDFVNDNGANALPAGCACSVVYYYYWARARDVVTQCESGFSATAAKGALSKWWLPSLSCRGAGR